MKNLTDGSRRTSCMIVTIIISITLLSYVFISKIMNAVSDLILKI